MYDNGSAFLACLHRSPTLCGAVERVHLRNLGSQVKYAMARDVRLEDLTSMIDKLGAWASTTQVLLATLEVIFYAPFVYLDDTT